MTKVNKRSYLSSRSLRRKLNIAFALMSVLPLLVCIYLGSNYIFPRFGLKLDVTATILISIFTAIIGFFVIKEILNYILSITKEAKLMAAGDINRRVDIPTSDEMNELGQALNQLTQNIRNKMEELKVYGERTTEINIGIQRRVLALSNLLQISSLISHDAKLEDVFKIALEKSRLVGDAETAYLLCKDEGKENFYMKAVDGINSDVLSKTIVEPQENIYLKSIRANKPFILDKNNYLSEDLRKSFYEKFKVKNTLAQPIYLKGKAVAIMGIGNNRENFSYTKDDIELLDVFAKQIAIALGNEALNSRINKLEIKDVLTGLYNETFIRNRLQEEIKRAIACQRPCAFVLLNIDNFAKFHQKFGQLQAEAILKRAALLVKECVSEIDRVARIGDNEFAIVFPEKNKRKAKELAEEIRKKIEFVFGVEQDLDRRITLSGGVSENPLDGVNADELITKAKETLDSAKTQGKNCIVM